MSKKVVCRLLCLLLSVLFVLTVAGCGDSGTESTPSSGLEDNGTVSDAPGSDVGDEPTTTTENSDAFSTDASGTSSTKQGSSGTTTMGKTSGKVTNTTTKSPGKKTSYTKEQIIAKMPAKLKGTTLKYFYWWDPYTQMDKEAIESFTKATGIKVQSVVASYSEFQTQLSSRIASGDSPDIVRLLSNATYQIVNLQPITNSGFEYFNDTAWDDRLMKDYTFNGSTYAANLKDSAIMDVGCFYYNKKALRNAKLEDPYEIWKKDPKKWTWDKFWSMCQEFVDAMPNQSTFAGSTWQYQNASLRYRGATYYDYDSTKGQWVNNMKSDTLVNAWQDMMNKYDKRQAVYTYDSSAFTRGYILFSWSGPFAARKKDTTYQTMKDQNNLGIVPMPTDGKQVLYEYTAFGIPQGAKNAAAAPYYMRWVLDKSSYNGMKDVYVNEQFKTAVEAGVARYDDYMWGENSIYKVEAAITGGTAAQVKAALDSQYGYVQGIVDDLNEQILYLNK